MKEHRGFTVFEALAANLIFIFMLLSFSRAAIFLAHGRTQAWRNILSSWAAEDKDCREIAEKSGARLIDCQGTLKIER